MKLEHQLRIALTTIACAAVAAPVALAGGEPKNDWPFNRPIADRTPSSLAESAASESVVPQGEPKNDWPFNRPIGDRTPSSLAATASSAAVVQRGESKNDVPFTRVGPAPIVVVRTGEGFDWSDAGIGAVATLGLAFAALGAVALRAGSDRRPRASGA